MAYETGQIHAIIAVKESFDVGHQSGAVAQPGIIRRSLPPESGTPCIVSSKAF